MHITEETREKLRAVNLGKKPSEETKRKMSESHKGEKHPNWLGGISFEPYTTDWTNTLKRSIRERDHYQCRFCNELQNDIAFDVHHIDYNKKNCNPDNLITLCRSCHALTNHNRKFWTKYFNKLAKLLH